MVGKAMPGRCTGGAGVVIEGVKRLRDLSPPRGRRGPAAAREAMSVTSGNYARVPVAIGLLILLGALVGCARCSHRELIGPVAYNTTWRSPVAGGGCGWEWTFRRRSWFQWGDTTTDWLAVDDDYAIADRCVRWSREELSFSLLVSLP